MFALTLHNSLNRPGDIPRCVKITARLPTQSAVTTLLQPAPSASQPTYVQCTTLCLWICSVHLLSSYTHALSISPSHRLSLSLLSLSLSLFNPRETQDPWSGYDYNPLMDSKLVSLSVDLLTYRFSRLALHISLCPALTHSFTQIS